MNKIALVMFLLFLAGCKNSKVDKVKPYVITSSELQKTVTYLASDELQGRATGSKGIEKAAEFIEAYFKTNHIKPYYKTYRDSFNVKNKVGYNVVGLIEGHDAKLKNEIVILGAHYDHIGFGKKVGQDSIANGANDDATGTAAVLALAIYFSVNKNNKRSILVTLYSGEELGLLGSNHLANKLKEKDINLYVMVNFEMIGVPFKDRDYDALLTGYDVSNMAQIMNMYSKANVFGKSDIAVKYNLFKQSDNYSFYEVFKVPSQTISSCDLSNFDFYHQVGDEADIMDYEHMANLINKTIPAMLHISNSPTKEIKLYD